MDPSAEHPGLPPDHLPALRARLADAPSVAAAAQAVIDHLAAHAGLMPSLYLERSGRLRCQAVQGYWQIRDGMPPEAGVIGRTFRTGRPTVELDVSQSGDYLAAATDVAAEICVPIRLGDEVVGALNVECPKRLPERLRDDLEACAAAYAERLSALGGPPPSSPAQVLLEHVGRLLELEEREELEIAILEAAQAITGLDSGLLLRQDAFGRHTPSRALGPLSAALYAITQESVAAIESFVSAGTSCYTVDQPGGEAPAGMRVLRAAGAHALIAHAVGTGEGEQGLLVVAGAEPVAPTTEQVELLELLAAHAAGVLRRAAAVSELRLRAATDPLTGLGHHATFHEALARERREHRDHLAVVMADIDGFKSINDTDGHLAGDRVLREVSAALNGALRRGDQLFRVGGDEFAALVTVADEIEALDAGRRLRAAATTLGEVTVSVGIAIPYPGEPDAGVLARADRALYAVKNAGRDGVALDGAPPS